MKLFPGHETVFTQLRLQFMQKTTFPPQENKRNEAELQVNATFMQIT